jgi:hypothetical protein
MPRLATLVLDINLMMFPNFHSLTLNLSISNFSADCLLTHNFSITFSDTRFSSERSYMKHMLMPFLVHHCVLSLILSLPVRRGSSVFIRILM